MLKGNTPYNKTCRIALYLKTYSSWKESPHRKPLILQGARQVGKTYSVLEFGRNKYENVAYFNFDEVQLCERALTSLKYFREKAPDYHIIVAGSLRGMAVNREQFSFPVGKVDIKTLNPMDFEEFLFALHDAAMDYYRQYLVVGGLAENYVCLSPIANGYQCYDWQPDRSAEVDFLIQREGLIIPIEVNSADNTRAKSLAEYIKSYKPDYAIKLSTKNFGFEDGKKTVPLYAAFCI